MKVSIFFMNGSVRNIDNVRRVTNAPTRIKRDWLHVYINGDERGHPTHRFPMADIICVEVSEC